MSAYDDFRTSMSPQTAKRRLDHFRDRRLAFDADQERRELAGIKDTGKLDTRWYYRRLLDAHVSFAMAQLREQEKRSASESALTSDLPEPVAGADLRCPPTGRMRAWLRKLALRRRAGLRPEAS